MKTNSAPVAFCETFDQPSTPFNRSGQLDGLVWGVSRYITAPGWDRPWPYPTTQLDRCGTIVTVNPPDNVQICNGQLREASNDAGAVSAQAMYPKQQFDFSGRVGTVAFDVSNDTAGGHAAWPEFWMSDQPVPVPFNHFGSWTPVPANGFGVRFDANAEVGSGGICPNGDNLDKVRFTVSSAVIVRDWLIEDENALGGSMCMDEYGVNCRRTGMKVTVKRCVIASDGPNGKMNHIELKISQNQIDVYATDAGTTAPLHLIATITNANLTLLRGFIWLEDAHYNASKGAEQRPKQTQHTFAWDNVAFDGPLVARERTFDVLEAGVPFGAGILENNVPGVYLGWHAHNFNGMVQPVNLTTIPIPAADLVAARTGALLFNFSYRDAPPNTITYKINGHTHVAAWPFPDRQNGSARAISLPVPLTELVMSPNQISIYPDQGNMEIANVNISLQGAGGIVAPK